MIQELIIKPKKDLSLDDLRELWNYRELLYFFTWRDLKVRYKQTALGILWAIFQPLVTMIVFSVFFGRLAGIPSDNIPYPIFVYVGLLLWQFFSSALLDTSNSLISNQAILTKVYLPRLILPISSVITKFVDFFFASFVLVGLMLYYRFLPNPKGIFLFPVLLFITFILSAGAGLFLAAFNIKYRDVRYILPFFIQLMLFVTPVIYPASIAGKYSWLLAINPMTGIIKAAQASILNTTPVNWTLLGISALSSIIILCIGLVYFKKTERYFADIV